MFDELKMKYTNIIKNRIIDLILSSLLSIILCIILIEPLIIQYTFGNIVLPVLIVNALMVIYILEKKYFLRTLIVISAGLLIFTLYSLSTGIIYQLLSQLLIYSNHLLNAFIYLESPDNQVGEIMVKNISIIISILVFIILVIKQRFLILLASCIIIYVVQMYTGIKINFFLFYSLIMLLLVLYCRWIYRKNHNFINSNKQNSNVKFIIYSIPICLIVFGLTYWIPKSDEPVELKFEQRRFNNQFFSFENLSRPRDFSISSSGFSSNSAYLGGEVRLDNTHVLNVYSTAKTYLTGAIRDIYTGYSWESSKEGYVFLADNEGVALDLEGKKPENYIMEIIEPLAAIPFIDSDFNIDELYRGNIMNIEHVNILTNTLFRPSKFHSLNFPQNQSTDTFFDYYSSIRSDNALPRGFRYNINYLLFNNFSDELENILKRSKLGIYSEIFNSSSYDIFYKNSINLTNELTINIDYETINRLQNYSDNIYEKYLQLPESLPSRVEDLAISLTTQIDNNYEKVKAIEYYLSNNFNYTLTPTSTPEENDFVDYFLFEGKEGYCVYYATAMTVMVRTLGIPARYVEGYKMPSESYITPDGFPTNIYLVTNENAHAWVEVYLEGFGWIPFEPTAAFTDEFYRFTESETGYDIDSDFEFSDFDDLEKNIIVNNFKFMDMAKIIIIISVASLIVLIIFNIYKIKKKNNKIYSSTPDNKIYYIMMDVHKLIKDLNISKFDYETYDEYLDRLKLTPGLFKKDGFNDFHKLLKSIIDIYKIRIYSNSIIMESQSLSALNGYFNIVSEIKKEHGHFKYYLYKYLFGRF